MMPCADAWVQGFRKTLKQLDIDPDAWQEALHAANPPFSMLTPEDIVPEHRRAEYHEVSM
jgi:membrane-bound lytic murein transglycosylase B